MAAGRPQPTGAASAGLTLMVNSSLADAIDANPGDGVCETAPGNGVCTLRAAVMEANAWPGADTIILPAGVYYLTLPATSFEDAALNGDLDLTDDVTIIGAGETETIIDGNRTVTNGRVFEIFAGVTVAMSRLTIRNGTNEPGPGIAGGILNRYGNLTLTHVTLTGNNRGGLDNRGGTALLDTVTYSNNFQHAAGLYNWAEGTMVVHNSIITGNRDNHGVAVGSGHLIMINTTISDNNGGLFVYNGSAATLINSTISGNRAPRHGGGIYVGQSSANYPTTLNLHNVTIADNVANTSQGGYTGGGIYVDTSQGFTPVVNITNSIITHNWLRMVGGLYQDCHGPINSGGYNLISAVSGCVINGVTTGNLVASEAFLGARLGPLAANGGFGHSHALLADSLAIDAGNPAGCADHLGALLATDQRGYQRSVDGGSGAARCDMGAYEYGAVALEPPAPPNPPPPPDSPHIIYLPLIQR
jgi:hypothetical protein